MANTLLTISMITNKALMVLENNLTFAKRINREYDDRFANSGAKIGDTINIRKPVRYVSATGPALQLQNATETSVPLVIDTQNQTAFAFTSNELTLDVDDFSDRLLKPAIAKIANDIDFSCLTLYRDVYNSVGTPGATPSALLTYLQAGVKLDNEATPNDGQRYICMNPIAQATIVDALKSLFQSSEQIKRQYEKGSMGTSANFDWYMDQNINVHTIGAYAGTPTVNGASQTGASLVTAGWSAGAILRQGDIITISTGTAVNAVNPQNYQSTGQLRQFVVTATSTADGAGALTIPISPSIVTSGAFQTVTASPDNGATVAVFGTASTQSPTNLAFHKDAFTLACVDLELPSGVDMAARASDKQLGLSMRIIRAYDINNDRFPCRVDLLQGRKTIRPELACRVAG